MSIPAGWYDDGQGKQRWWDGTQWTDQFAPEAAPAAPAAPVAPAPQSFPAAPAPATGYAAPAPEYGAAPVGAPAKKKSPVGLFIGLAVVALLVIGGAIAAVLFLLGGNKGGAGSPEEAVEKGYGAVIAGDCEEAVKYVYESDDSDLEKCEDSVKEYEEIVEAAGGDELEFEVKDSEIDGDEAVVTVEVTFGEESFEDVIDVEKHDGRWYLGTSFGDDDEEADDEDSDDEATEEAQPTEDEEPIDDEDGTDDSTDSSDLASTGTLYDPADGLDSSDPQSVAATYEWTYWVTSDCATNLATIDIEATVGFGQTEDEYCATFYGPIDADPSAEVYYGDVIDNGDGTVTVSVLYLNEAWDTSWEEDLILEEQGGSWLVIEYVTTF